MTDFASYRNLTIEEISQLKDQYCLSDDWSLIKVANRFKTDNIHHARFSGEIKLGVFDHEFIVAGGLRKKSGLRHVTLHNCTVADNTLIENVANYIANYHIGEYCYIQNLNLMLVDELTSFGNGVEVSVLNETGGREVPIYNEMSAHIAYVMALYRHRPVLIDALRAMIAKYAQKVASNMGHVNNRVTILNTGTLRNVAIGDNATLSGVSRLETGSINSNTFDPVYVGHNVIGEDFIFSSGAHVSDGAVVVRCFVGQACHISHLFSAHDSLFFCNCQGENGEACAIFAGPYTVSMHKSSLLIAGMFSFLNAGSGSNQSNHMYKLGPIHQGIVERGSKTTSDSYILWPAKVGAFSLVMGRHVHHSDTSALPFSYLIEKSDTSFVVPGVNLRSVGTIRDAQKWPKRDKRKDPNKLDLVNFNLLSPYTIQKMLNAIDVLNTLRQTSGETSEVYSYQSANIRNSSLNNGIKLYAKAINKFLGNSLIKRLEGKTLNNDADIRRYLKSQSDTGCGEWIDLSGLIAPKEAIEELLSKIESGEIETLNEINDVFVGLHNNYYDIEWNWACRVIQEWYGVDIDTITAADVQKIVYTWLNAVVSLDNTLYTDAKKEFRGASRTGFGIDGDTDQSNDDFYAVRGDFETNPFVVAVKQHIESKKVLGDELISRLPI